MPAPPAAPPPVGDAGVQPSVLPVLQALHPRTPPTRQGLHTPGTVGHLTLQLHSKIQQCFSRFPI